MKKLMKILTIVLVLIMVGLAFNNYALAWDMNLDSYENVKADRAGNAATSLVGSVINIVSIFGAGVAIVMLIVIGIKYVSEGAEGKAEAKKDLTGYLIGASILFGVSGILKLLQMFIDANLNKI